MSFTGAGPLGTLGWGTTTAQALEAQANEIAAKYKAVVAAITSSKNDTSNKQTTNTQPFPSLGDAHTPHVSDPKVLADAAAVWPAAVLTANELENWPVDKRVALAARKREFSNQPQDVIDATNEFRTAQLQSLERRHAAIEALSPVRRAVLYDLAAWMGAVVTNLRLREILCYPLIRDQLPGGVEFYTSALNNNDKLREQLRTIRRTIYDNASSTEWYSAVGAVQEGWQHGWTEEKGSGRWLQQLTEYLKHTQVSALRDICAAHDSLAEPNPPTSHDMNYGQQIVQLYQIGYMHLVRTGNFQGIPRPRWAPDWSCTDGFEPAHQLGYGPKAGGERGKPPKPTGLGVRGGKEESHPQHLATELPPLPSKSDYVPFGAGMARITVLPDNVQLRSQFTVENLKRAKESLDAINSAHIAHYGSVEAHELEVQKHIVENGAEKATSLQEYLKQVPHTTDLEGSYYWNEVQLAFRNHGTHWESLAQDITPLGEHYLLIHYDVQYFHRTLDSYRLKVYGCVEHPVVLTMKQVLDMAKDRTYSMPMIMECSGNGRAMMKPRYNQHVPWGLQAFGCYCWTGTPLRTLIDRIGVSKDCVDVVFTGYDAGLEKEKELRYFQHSLEINDPIIDFTWLVWMNNGVDLLPEHGYPLRIMTPAWYGNANIKWLQSIEFMPRKFTGVYQRTYSYTKTPTDNDIAAPSQELRPRAMLKPIGYPDFTTRKRFAVAGEHTWYGKCWVGGGHYRAIIAVELSLDHGASWLMCHLEPRLGVFAWANFNLVLDLPVGLYQVVIRATDNLGNRQVVDLEEWNWASMQDDAVQNIELTVVENLSFME